MATSAPNAGNWNQAVIYDAEFFTLMTETLQQFAEVFNADSAGTIIIQPQELPGDFEKNSFFKHIPDLVSSRDPKSNADVADKNLEQDELVNVKVARRIGPTAQTLDFWRRQAEDPMGLSLVLGEQTGIAVAVDYVNVAIASLNAAMEGMGGEGDPHNVTVDVGAETDNKLRTEYLVRGNARLGDRAQRIRAYVMHSKVWHDLIEGQIVDGNTNIADVVAYGGNPATLGRPAIVTDSSELSFEEEVETGVFEDRYITLGLVEGACVIKQTEDQYVTMQEITGQDNIVWRLQGEYGFIVAIRGNAYTGLEHPDTDDLATAANWNFVMHDRKLGPGIRVISA